MDHRRQVVRIVNMPSCWLKERERIANFLAVPLAVERVTLFGALLCLDGFLYNFTILPVRATVAVGRVLTNLWHRLGYTSSSRSSTPLAVPPGHMQAIVRTMLLVIPTIILLAATDASKMYHSVRGQDTIKLYVIFNALEVRCTCFSIRRFALIS